MKRMFAQFRLLPALCLIAVAIIVSGCAHYDDGYGYHGYGYSPYSSYSYGHHGGHHGYHGYGYSPYSGYSYGHHGGHHGYHH